MGFRTNMRLINYNINRSILFTGNTPKDKQKDLSTNPIVDKSDALLPNFNVVGYVPIQTNEDIFEKGLEQVENEEEFVRLQGWQSIVKLTDTNKLTKKQSTKLMRPLFKALDAENIREQIFASRILKDSSASFVSDKKLTNLMIKNLNSENEALRHITISALDNRYTENHLTDDNINRITPYLFDGLKSENKKIKDGSLHFLTQLAIDKKITKKDVEYGMPTLEEMLYSDETYTSNYAYTIISELSKQELLPQTTLECFSKGLQQNDEKIQKRSLHFILNDTSEYSIEDTKQLQPLLLKTLSSKDDVVRGMTLKLLNNMYKKNALDKNFSNFISRTLLENIDNSNVIISVQSLNLLKDMYKNNDIKDLDCSHKLGAIYKGMQDNNPITRNGYARLAYYACDRLPERHLSGVLSNALRMVEHENSNFNDNYRAFKISEKILKKHNYYRYNRQRVDNLILNNYLSEEPKLRQASIDLFSEMYGQRVIKEEELVDLSHKICEDVLTQDEIHLDAYKFLIKIAKNESLDSDLVNRVADRMLDIAQNGEGEQKSKSAFVLSKFIDARTLKGDKLTEVRDFLNNTDSITTSTKLRIQSELIAKNMLDKGNIDNFVSTLYENLSSDDYRVRYSALRTLPDLYTRGVLPRREDEFISFKVLEAINSENTSARNAGIKALGDMAVVRAVGQETASVALPLLKDIIKDESTTDISRGIAIKTFGEFAARSLVTKDEAIEMEKVLTEALDNSDIISKTIIVETLANLTRVQGVRLHPSTTKTLNREIYGLLDSPSNTAMGSVIKSMTWLEKFRLLDSRNREKVKPMLMDDYLTSSELRHRGKAINLLRFMKRNNHLTSDEIIKVDNIINDYPKHEVNEVLAELIGKYNEANPTV